MKFPNSSIALRLVIVLGVLLSLAAGAGVYAAYRYGRTAADEAFDRLLTGAALQIAERIGVADGHPIVDLPSSAFQLLSLAPNDRVFYRIIGPSGKTITGSNALPQPDKAAVSGPQIFETAYRGAPVRAVAVYRRLAEQSVFGDMTVIVAHTTEARADLARDIATKAMAAVAFATILIIAMAFWATRFALRPLGVIEDAIKSRDPLDLQPIEGPAPREVETLVYSINQFMTRLNRRVQDMHDFVADTAHQMRTPITAMRAQTEMAMDEDDPERLKSMLVRIRRRAIGVSRLMEQLLSRALVIHRSDTAPLVRLDLRRAALEAEREYLTSAQTVRGRILLELPESEVVVTADAFSLKEAIKNLLANSFTHGTPPVTLAVEMSGDFHALIKVSDCGAGLREERVKTLGKRYARDDDKPESAGLGIAIVERVLSYTGGTLLKWRDDDGRLWLAMRLPLAEEAE